MIATTVMALLAVPIFLCGVLFLIGKEDLLYMASERPRQTSRVTERIVVGVVCVFFGGLILATAYGVLVVDNPYWLVDRVFSWVR